jgi:hypothetical protein
MAFFGKLRLSKATTLMLLFALVMGMMNISVANAQEVRNSSSVAMRIAGSRLTYMASSILLR